MVDSALSPPDWKNYYFGEHWGVPALNHAEQVKTPIGRKCYWCEEEIVEGDQGFMRAVSRVDGAFAEPIHRECDFRAVSGSLGHHLELCSCFGGPMEDPQELTRRQSAIAVWRLVARSRFSMFGAV